MNQQPDIEKLAAYILDELDGAERKAVADAIESDETTRATVAELRATSRMARETFAERPRDTLTEQQRQAVLSQTRGEGREQSRRVWRASWASVAAAGLLIALGISVLPNVQRAREAHRRSTAENEQRRALQLHEDRSLREADETFGRVSVLVRGELDSLRAPAPGSHPEFMNDPSKVYWPEHNTEAYDRIVENPFLDVIQNPLSTFSIDVDTASYSNLRRYLNQNALPPKGAVRIEELVNYFRYDYVPPTGDDPFAAHVEVADCPWNPEHRLARIALKGREIAKEARPPTNLVFLIDVSGSMAPDNKLPLLRRAMKLLVEQMTENDHIAMAVYAGAAGLVLPSTPGDQQEAILDALDRLEAGGSTNGGQGIRLAYDTAVEHFIPGGVNRVILATDGDFNVGITDESSLIALIEERAKTGVFLTVLGFGMGNLKYSALEMLADKGNGNYAYIDTLSEARKVLVEQMAGTLITIAKDVKIQVEFNPAQVRAYRLIGYENRLLAAEDFNDDTKDAGEIGAGHTVTAFYELVLVGAAIDLPPVDPLRYQQRPSPADASSSGDLFTLKLRYKQPDGDASTKLEFPVRAEAKTLAQASPDFRFAAAVAGFGMLLRDSEYKGDATFDSVYQLAEQALGEDPFGYRAEFLRLVRMAESLASRSTR